MNRNKKIVSLLLVCLVAMSIVYSCSGTALSSHQTQSDDVVSSSPSKTTEGLGRSAKLAFREPNLEISGDPVDDPKPRKK